MGTNRDPGNLSPSEPQFPFSALSEAIKRKVELEWGTEDDEYLDKVERNLERALQEHVPDVVVYNAGTDILEGDRLGGLSISPQVRTDLRQPKRVCSAESAAAEQVGHTGAASAVRVGISRNSSSRSRARPAAGLPDATGSRPARVTLLHLPTGRHKAG